MMAMTAAAAIAVGGFRELVRSIHFTRPRYTDMSFKDDPRLREFHILLRGTS